MPEFSIITVCLNSEQTISDCVRTVREQAGVSVEHVVKDGGSKDTTVKIAEQINPEVRVIVSSDAGIYDAMNQGFSCCSGKFVGFLNSDDYYASPDVLETISHIFNETDCAIVYGDISIVDSKCRVVRRWKAGKIKQASLNGRQLPHPAFFVRRDILACLERPFDPSYQISADLKQQLILVEKLGLRAEYIPRVITIMRAGGTSSLGLGAFFAGWVECARAYREVHGRSGFAFVVRKVLAKMPQIRIFRGRSDHISSESEGTGGFHS